MLIQERIQLIIKANNLTPSQFADKIDIKRSNLSHVLSGRNNPSLDFLSKIISNFPNVNASWLITGDTREEQLSENANSTASNDPQIINQSSEKAIERIVCFYTDGTFEPYTPNK